MALVTCAVVVASLLATVDVHRAAAATAAALVPAIHNCDTYEAARGPNSFSVDFNYSAKLQHWVVPPDVAGGSVCVDVSGGQGGAGRGSVGGLGGAVNQLFAVSSGHTYTISTGDLGLGSTTSGGTGGGGTFVFDSGRHLLLAAGGGGGGGTSSGGGAGSSNSTDHITGAGVSGRPGLGGGGATTSAPGAAGGPGATAGTGPTTSPVKLGRGGSAAPGGGNGGGGYFGGGGGGGAPGAGAAADPASAHPRAS
jgi:hypothetical protein